MRVVTHLQGRIPCPSATLEAPGRLLAPGSVEAIQAFARRPVSGIRAPTTVQTWARSARFDFREVSGSAGAFCVSIDSDTDQCRLVGVHHVR